MSDTPTVEEVIARGIHEEFWECGLTIRGQSIVARWAQLADGSAIRRHHLQQAKFVLRALQEDGWTLVPPQTATQEEGDDGSSDSSGAV